MKRPTALRRVAVLCGGFSKEREISLVSGNAAARALEEKGLQVTKIDVTRDMAKLVPELLVSDFARSLKFYTEVLGFKQLYDRPEEAFAYLDRYGAQIMIVRHDAGDEPSWIAAELAQPYGRGMNLEIEVEDVDALHDSCVGDGSRIFLAMEEKWYRRDAVLLGVRQFIVMDPDGYLLRLSQSLGTRSATGEP